jgi:hypothetical protein
MAGVLRAHFGDSALVLAPECYRMLGTYDGVDACASRVLPELRAVVAAHPSLCALSLLGYSFGGLVARFLAGALLVEPRPFLGLQPLNLVTFACPHLGPTLLCAAPAGAPEDAGAAGDGDSDAEESEEGAAARAQRRKRAATLSLAFLRHLAGASGAQMALHDPFQLLLLMAHPRSAFYRVRCLRGCCDTRSAACFGHTPC